MCVCVFVGVYVYVCACAWMLGCVTNVSWNKRACLRVREAFQQDLNIAIDECHVLYGYKDFQKFPEEVREILVNMMFNLGRPRLSKFVKMNNHIRNREWALAAVEGRDSLWYKQVINRAERLMSRLENVS